MYSANSSSESVNVNSLGDFLLLRAGLLAVAFSVSISLNAS